jgi:hypothetical protein
VSQYTVSAPDPSTLSDSESGDPVWLIRLLKDGCLAMTLGAESQAERDQWLSSLYTAATTPIKVPVQSIISAPKAYAREIRTKSLSFVCLCP